MSKKRGTAILASIVVLFFASLLYRNISTFNSLKNHPGYTIGIITEVWNDGDWNSRYTYSVKGTTYQHRQEKQYGLHDTVLIIYDKTKPRFSMIAEYPSTIILDSSGKITLLDTSLIKYSWWHYMPVDEIRSIKDLWSLD